jgi:tRNA threonylcarbamoyladenosine biosynthesis protein TsaB
MKKEFYSHSTLLAIDTCNGPSSVALKRQDSTVFTADDIEPGRQAEQLLPTIQQLLIDAHTTFKDLTDIAITLGPGSFTGVRLAIATAKGLQLGGQYRTHGISTLTLAAHYAYQEERTHPILAILDARRDQYYVQWFDTSLHPTSPPTLTAIDTLISTLQHTVVTLTGSGANDALPFAAKGSKSISKAPKARHIIDALHNPDIYKLCSQTLSPIYLRPPDAKLPQTKPGNAK